MKINRNSGKTLCDLVLKSVTQWRAMPLALQCGGLEIRGRGRFASALEKWLIDSENSELLVLPEYRKKKGRIDFILVPPESVFSFRLEVDTLFEVKFNYASQAGMNDAGDIGRQILTAIGQARAYKEHVHAHDAYILYLLAAPTRADIPGRGTDRDGGWQYWRMNNDHLPRALRAIADTARSEHSRVIGNADFANARKGYQFHCWLLSV